MPEEVIRREFPAELAPSGDGRTLDLRIVPYNVKARVQRPRPRRLRRGMAARCVRRTDESAQPSRRARQLRARAGHRGRGRHADRICATPRTLPTARSGCSRPRTPTRLLELVNEGSSPASRWRPSRSRHRVVETASCKGEGAAHQRRALPLSGVRGRAGHGGA